MTDLFMIGLMLFEIVILYVVLKNVVDIRKMQADIEQLRDTTARMSKVIAEHQAAIELLGENGEEPLEEESHDLEKTLDAKYNEGMDNIFGYSVNTGININRGN